LKPLIKALIQRNLISPNNVLSGRMRAKTLGGIVLKVNKTVYFNHMTKQGFICNDELGKKYLMEFDDLSSIDGMDLARYARVYNVKPDGTAAKLGKKRGRKPKIAINNSNGGSENGKNQRTNTDNQIESTA